MQHFKIHEIRIAHEDYEVIIVDDCNIKYRKKGASDFSCVCHIHSVAGEVSEQLTVLGVIDGVLQYATSDNEYLVKVQYYLNIPSFKHTDDIHVSEPDLEKAKAKALDKWPNSEVLESRIKRDDGKYVMCQP